jgi:hypothetical protein
LSDHKPILLNINLIKASSNNTINNSNIQDVELVTLPPNLDNEEMNLKFNKTLEQYLYQFNNITFSNSNNDKQSIINNTYGQFSNSIKSAYSACSRTCTLKSLKEKKWFTKELRDLREKMLFLRFNSHQSDDNSHELKKLKKDFKKIMKKNIYLYEKNEYFKIGKLIKCNNGDKFFKEINKILNKDKSKIDIPIDTLAQHYHEIFNRPLCVTEEVINQVNQKIENIKIEYYESMNIELIDLELTIKQTKLSNVCGNDGLSSRMIKNCNNFIIATKLLFFFRFIFTHGVIPDDINITHIIPIKKDKNKSINDTNNLRPISISNTLAQIFERLLMTKINSINNTHTNQFGYKNKTSCSHGLFTFKETIIWFLENNKHCYAAFLDAIKAFDNLWRQALYLKMMDYGILLSPIILLKIYYDKLAGKIKINNIFSKLFRLMRGVKQGGVLSGALFNFFINDLIEECYQSGVGAVFIDIIVAILVFCDDICLLSPNENEMQILLNICSEYSRKWALEFNITKCKFMVFGSSKFNNTKFFLNGLPLKFSNNVKYLGIEFNRYLNFSNFFIDRFKNVSNSYFSLNSFGFKPGGVSPFLQAFIYKSYSISRLLYGLEIMQINKKTLSSMNLSQNSIIRFMTGLSKNSHISNTRKILKIMNIEELYIYMKLIFIKNLKNNSICLKIFNHLLIIKYKKNTKSFIKDFKNTCNILQMDSQNVINNIRIISIQYKESCLNFEKTTETELIKICLENNHDYKMIQQLNLVTYAGPQ